MYNEHILRLEERNKFYDTRKNIKALASVFRAVSMLGNYLEAPTSEAGETLQGTLLIRHVTTTSGLCYMQPAMGNGEEGATEGRSPS